LLPGLIVYAHGAYTCDCKFRSLSATGARIAVSELLQFPERFHVINIRDGVAYDSRLVWNKGLDIGVKIESVVRLTRNDDFLMARLKKLWLAKSAR
jgi:hypothetical protein